MMPVSAGSDSLLGRASLPASADLDATREAAQPATRRAFGRAEWFPFLLFLARPVLVTLAPHAQAAQWNGRLIC
ncbi:MAG: hypothetical protein ACRDJC_12105 [Thermomicrobiales bacterium]